MCCDKGMSECICRLSTPCVWGEGRREVRGRYRRHFQPSLFKQGPGQRDRVATLPMLLVFSPQTFFFLLLPLFDVSVQKKKKYSQTAGGEMLLGPLPPSARRPLGVARRWASRRDGCMCGGKQQRFVFTRQALSTLLLFLPLRLPLPSPSSSSPPSSSPSVASRSPCQATHGAMFSPTVCPRCHVITMTYEKV